MEIKSPEQFAKVARAARALSGKSQLELAKEINIAPTTLKRIELGKDVRLSTLFEYIGKMAKYLDQIHIED